MVLLLTLAVLAANPKPSTEAPQAVADAIAKAELEALKKALDAGVSPSAVRKGVPLIALAADKADKAAIELLLSRGAIADAVDREGETALHHLVLARASEPQKEECARVLLPKFSAKALPQLLDYAVTYKGARVVKVLVEAKVPLPKGILHRAAESTDHATMLALLAAKPALEEKDARGATPFAVGVGSYYPDREEVLLALLDAGAVGNVQTTGLPRPALMAAADRGFARVVDRLIKAGADVKRDGVAALSSASRKGSLEIVRLLLAAGVSPEDPPGPGFSWGPPLWISASEGRGEIVKLLLTKAKVVDVEWRGTTALMEAARNGHVQIVEQLLAAGADLTRKSAVGQTARMLAESEGRTEVILAIARIDKKPPPDANQAIDAIIWAGGKTEADGKKWLDQWTREAAEYRNIVVPADGYPRAVKSDDVPGMNKGFHVVVLGYCASNQTARVLSAFKSFAERVYVRRVTQRPDHDACPTLPVSKARRAFAMVGAERRLHAALWPAKSGAHAFFTLRDKEGLRLGFAREEGLDDCDVELTTDPFSATVTWDCSDTPRCHQPSHQTATATISGDKLEVAVEQGVAHWDDSCGE